MRNMSFMLTTEQMRNRTKTVTRRLGWQFLKVGDRIRACVKCQGLKKGERVETIGIIEVVDVRREKLIEMHNRTEYGKREAILEGFGHLTGSGFVGMFTRDMKCRATDEVTRIQFVHVRSYSITLTDEEFEQLSDRSQHLRPTLSLSPGIIADVVIQREDG